MTLREVLTEATQFLTLAEIETPFLDATLLLAFLLRISKEQLFASLNERMSSSLLAQYRDMLHRRAEGVPVSYLRRCKEFYGLEFYVDERVLVPRPDTEILVEEALALVASGRVKQILDLCSGSGCIAITLKKLYPELRIVGSDISALAGEVFRKNCELILDEEIPFVLSDLFSNIKESFDLIVSNPPYLKDETVEALKDTGWPEPALALKGGPDGTSLLIKIIEQAQAHLKSPGWLLLEASPEQIPYLLKAMVWKGYLDIRLAKDLAGNERVLIGRKG